MTYGSLFSGIGGLDLGLDRAGFQCRWQVEKDDYCNRILEKHWPAVKRYGDITTVTGDELEPVDLIAGGFPCQDLSQAGKRAGIEGTRSGLWAEYARLVGRLRPRYVLVENVPGLLVSDAMRRVVGDLARLGYVGCWRSLRASEFGASHLRKRVFLVAYRERDGWNERRAESEGLKWRFDATECNGAVEDAARDEQPGFPGEDRRMRGRGVCAASEPLAYADAEGSSSAERRRTHEQRGADLFGASGSALAHGHAGRREVERCGELFDGERASRGNDADGCDPHVGVTASIRQYGMVAISEYDDGRQATQSDVRTRNVEPSDGMPVAHGPWNGRDEGRAEPAGLERRPDADERGGAVADAGNGLLSQQGRRPEGRDGFGSGSAALEFAPGPSDLRWPAILGERPDLAPAIASFRGVADGLPAWMDGAMTQRTKRLGRLGNSVVPQVAEWVGRRILEFETA